MNKAGTPYTPEDVALLERATAAGLDNESIAKLLGRTVKSVESKRHDITARKVGRAPGQTKIYSTVSAEDRFARLMGNKRYDAYKVKSGTPRTIPAEPSMSLTGSSATMA